MNKVYPDDDPELLKLQHDQGKLEANRLDWLLGLICEECARNVGTRIITERCPYPHQREQFIEGWMDEYKRLPRLKANFLEG